MAHIQPGPSGYKRSLGNTDNSDNKNNFSKKLRVDLNLDENSKYISSGVKTALHGTIYQLILLVLFVKRSIRENYDFYLATEMDAAEKFDDIVYKYKLPQEKDWKCSFVQVKHKLDPIKNKITYNDLFIKKDKDFFLPKYVLSFCKIEGKEDFQEFTNTYFTLLTNTNFVGTWSEYFEKEEDLQDDAMLYFENGSGKSIRFKNDDKTVSDISRQIKSIFLKVALEAEEIVDLPSIKDKLEAIEILDLKKITEDADTAFKKLVIECKNKKRKGKIKEITEKILTLKGKGIAKTEFVDFKKALDKLSNTLAKDKNYLNVAIKEVSKTAKKLIEKCSFEINEAETKLKNYKRNDSNEAKALKKNIEELSKVEKYIKEFKKLISETSDIQDIQIKCKEDILKKRIPEATLAKIQKKTDQNLEEVKQILDKLLDKLLSDISIIQVVLEDLDGHLKMFLKKFRFVVDYPSVDELNGLIRAEFGEDFKFLNAALINHSFKSEILNWFKSYSKGKAKYISKANAKEFLNALEGQINTIMASGLSSAYPDKLRSYGIQFKTNLEGLDSFLSGRNQILHIKTEETLLSAMKLLGTLESETFKLKYTYLEKKDGLIFMQLKTLLVFGTQDYIIGSFDKRETHHLLIIECMVKNSYVNDAIEKLHDRLTENLRKDSSKKIILIAPNEHILASKHFNNLGKDEINDDENNFEHLSPQSQDALLQRNIDIQGEYRSLKLFLDKISANEAIDQTILSSLMERKIISIGNQTAFSSIGYKKEYYVNRKLYLNEPKTEQEAQNPELISEEYFIYPENLNQKAIIIANDAGMGKSTILTSLARKMKRIDDENKNGFYPARWIIRFNLNDYALNRDKIRDRTKKKKFKSLKDISFQEDNINEAIDFLSEMAVPGDNNNSYIKFQRKLFIKGIGNMIIFFDGYDEICPTYKEKTQILLKALKNTNIVQFWITTRNHEKEDLENILETTAYILKELSEEEQEMFLNKFWKWSLKQKIQDSFENIFEYISKFNQINEESQSKINQFLIQFKKDISFISKIGSFSTGSIESIENIISTTIELRVYTKEQFKLIQNAVNVISFFEQAKKLLVEWKNSINDTEKAFANVPLNLQMIAEVIFEKKFQIPIHFGLYDRFKEFIDIKQDIFKGEKAKALEGNQASDVVFLWYSRTLDTIHCKLALEEFFQDIPPTHEEIVNYIMLNEDKGELSNYKNMLYSNGKNEKTEIQRAGLVTFLSDGSPRFIHRSFLEFFLSKFMFKKLKVENVQMILVEHILKMRDFLLIRKFLNCQLENNELEDIEIAETVKESLKNNFVLHQIALEGNQAIAKFLLEKLRDNKKFLKNFILKKNYEGNTALDTASLENQFAVVHELLESVKINFEEKEAMQILSELLLQKGILIWLVEECHIKTACTLLQDMKNFPTILKKLLTTRATDNSTILHKACRNSWCDSKFFNELLMAIKNTFEDAAQIHREFILTTDNVNEDTVLHILAMWKEHKDSTCHLLESIKDDIETINNLMKKQNNEGENVLHIAVNYDNVEFIEVIAQYFKGEIWWNLITTRNERDEVALDLALWNDDEKIAFLLINNITNEDLSNRIKHKKKVIDEIKISLRQALNTKNAPEVINILNHYNAFEDELNDLILKHLKQVIYQRNFEQIKFLLNLPHGIYIFKNFFIFNPPENTNQELMETFLNWSEKLDKATLEEMLQTHDEAGNTILHKVALEYSADNAEYLLNWINRKCGSNFLEKLLLQYNEMGRSALDLIAYRGLTQTLVTLLNWIQNYHPKIVDELILKTSIQRADTILHYAAFRGFKDVIKKLLEFIDVNYQKNYYNILLKQNQHDLTALHEAAQLRKSEAVHVLLQSARNLDYLKKLLFTTDKDKNTALDLANNRIEYTYERQFESGFQGRNITADLLREQYNLLISVLLEDERGPNYFSTEELELLERYVKNDYNGKLNSKVILDKIKIKLN